MKRTCLLSMPFAALLVLCGATAASGMYHPTLGRWVSRDPIGYADGIGLYEYGASAPSTNTDPQGSNAAMPEHSAAVKLPPPQYSDTPAPVTVLNKQAKVRLEEVTLAAGGSIELGDNGPQVANLDQGANLAEGAMLALGALGRAFNRLWYGVDADIDFEHSLSTTALSAHLKVSVSADRPREWTICPAYVWRLKVHNVCCMSEMVRVNTYSEQAPGAIAAVPTEGVFPLPLGGDPLILSPDTRLQIIQRFAGQTSRREFQSSARVVVAVKCEE